MRIRYLLLHAYGMGGTIRTVVAQANAMAERGHDVELVSVVRRRDAAQFRIDPRVRLSALVDERDGRQEITFADRVMRRLRGKAVPYGEFAARYFTPHVEKAVTAYVRGLDGGVLVTTRPALNLMAARHAPRGVVTVGQEHMNLSTHHEAVRRAIARWYPRLAVVAVLTRTDQTDYRKLAPGVRTVHIPNAVSGAGRRRATLTAPTVIAAGRLRTQKGFDLLIPAFEQIAPDHPGWRLDIYGEGPKLQALRGSVKLRGQVKLHGRTSRLDEELANASIFALSSRFEGLPMVMLEAMAHGLAVAGFDCPTGPGDVLVDGVNGLLVPPEDVAGLGRAIARLMDDPGLRQRLGEAALETAAQYAPEAIMPRWEELFTELLAAR
ncbi:glycosyltransferase family 4 protein [Acrocarpospora catenulata]|uniref:glycosyltransferase family 4 protein n=1 Tax=Acrocarpospora catenulata TaxID=2836182 RepID=UPI001BDAE2EA|nr:glycosyltransferase family 4 protein [Acrocarpospora catenulata]